MNKELISIIICAHNEEKYIEPTLKSIKKLNYSNFEMIVVCDTCKDKTNQIAKKYTKNVFNVNFKNTSKVRNFGAKKAKGKILVFFDADTLASENYLKKIKNYVKKGFEFGCAKFVSETKTIKGRLVTHYINRYNKRNKTVGGNCFVTKKLFNEIKGFNTKMAKGEDTYFGNRLRQQGAKYKYMTDTYIIPSERKFKEYGYLKYFSNEIKESLIYKFNKKKYKKLFKH